VFITAGTLWEKRFGRQHHLVTANLIQCSAALGVALPAALLLEECTVNWTPTLVASLGYLVIFNSIIAMTLLFAMIRRGAASRVTALFFLVPPTSSVIAWALLGEALPALTFVGMALAAVGLLLVGRPLSR
jgi:drug/metabolite transporter (DMT)-like permease